MLNTYTVKLLQHYTGMELDSKDGDDIADILHAYADEGCLSGGDTLKIIDNTETND